MALSNLLRMSATPRRKMKLDLRSGLDGTRDTCESSEIAILVHAPKSFAAVLGKEKFDIYCPGLILGRFNMQTCPTVDPHIAMSKQEARLAEIANAHSWAGRFRLVLGFVRWSPAS